MSKTSLPPVGTRVKSTMSGRSHWTGIVVGTAGVHNDMIRVRRDNYGGVSDWNPEQWTPVQGS